MPEAHAGAGHQARRRASWRHAACPSARPNTFSIWPTFRAERVHVDKWAEMDDEAVIAELMQIRGIGRWTAEMFLIFNLLRPNVLPLDDLGPDPGASASIISRGEPVSRSDAREVAANWEPWRTVATWYCGAVSTRCRRIIEVSEPGRCRYLYIDSASRI